MWMGRFGHANNLSYVAKIFSCINVSCRRVAERVFTECWQRNTASPGPEPRMTKCARRGEWGRTRRDGALTQRHETATGDRQATGARPTRHTSCLSAHRAGTGKNLPWNAGWVESLWAPAHAPDRRRQRRAITADKCGAQPVSSTEC